MAPNKTKQRRRLEPTPCDNNGESPLFPIVPRARHSLKLDNNTYALTWILSTATLLLHLLTLTPTTATSLRVATPSTASEMCHRLVAALALVAPPETHSGGPRLCPRNRLRPLFVQFSSVCGIRNLTWRSRRLIRPTCWAYSV